MVKLSKRLEAVAALAEPGSIAVDVGCDHGYVSIYLAQQNRFAKLIAMDVRSGPLEAAGKNIQHYQIEEKVETRLSDGLQNLAFGEADSMICAGMGGALICRILGNDLPKVEAMKQIILQPQSEIHLVRRFLRMHGLTIVKEDMVKEEGKYYPMFRAVPCKDRAWEDLPEEASKDIMQSVYDHYGRLLLEAGHPVLKEWLQQEQQVTGEICLELRHAIEAETKEADAGRRKKRLLELEEKQMRIQKALDII